MANFTYDRDGTPEEERAYELLLCLLTPHQRRVMRERGYIPVRGSQGGQWQIMIGDFVGNCRLILPKKQTDVYGRPYRDYCAHLPPFITGTTRDAYYRYHPLADQHVAQMLAIQANESEFLATAH